jgi:hypothetical protein
MTQQYSITSQKRWNFESSATPLWEPKAHFHIFYNAHVILPFNTTEPFGVICFMEFVYNPMLKIDMQNFGDWIGSHSQA